MNSTIAFNTKVKNFTDSHSVREMVMKRKARSLERKEIGTINSHHMLT